MQLKFKIVPLKFKTHLGLFVVLALTPKLILICKHDSNLQFIIQVYYWNLLYSTISASSVPCSSMVDSTRVTYLRVFFKTSACPRFCKGMILFCSLRYEIWGGGGENPLTIDEIYTALTPSGSRSDWASDFAAAT